MSIFPQGTQYYEESDKHIIARMESFYADSITMNQSFWGEADIDTRFESGDQSVWGEMYGNHIANKRQFSFNRIRRIVNMVGGYQRRNRKSSVVVPVENGDQETADQFSKILTWANNRENVLETLSESFHGALVTGMNLMQVWVDYRSDPIAGNIRVDNCSYNSFLIDPFFRKADLSDCNGIWKRSFLTKRECLSLLPSESNLIDGMSGNSGADGKFQFMPESTNSNINTGKLLTYDEFYYRDYRSQKMLIDSQTGESFEWKGEDDELRIFLALYPQITTLDQEVPTVNLAIVVQGRVVFNGPNPIGIDKYPFVPVLGYYNPEIPHYSNRIQGMVRGLRDAQYLYNRRKGIELDILESQINSGWKYKENALVDPKDVFLAGQGRGLALKEDAMMTDVERILPAQIPPSMLQLSEVLGKEIQEISGVNEELLGSAQDDKAGILSMLRQGAGLTTLQRLFDQLDSSQKNLSRLMLSIIQANFTPGKVKRIIEEDPSEGFYNKNFGVYDAAVEEGFNTTTQRQMNFAQLMQLREAGLPIPDSELLRSATIQNKTELIKTIEEQQQAQQKQQQMEQNIALEQEKAKLELAQAQAVAEKGLGIERISRVNENQAMVEERHAEAEKDKQAALLDRVKAIKELQDIDISQIERLLTLANMLKDREASASVGQEMNLQNQPAQPEPML